MSEIAEVCRELRPKLPPSKRTNDRKSWPVVLPAEVRDKLSEIEYLDDRLRVLRRELQLLPTAAERNVTEWPWE